MRLLTASLLSVLLVATTMTAVTPAVAADTTFTQPSDVTVLPGGSATFTVGVTTAYSFAWYRVGSTTPVSTGSASYTLASVTEADDGAQFYATFYDAGFTKVQTRAATLTVGTGELRFAADPQDVTVFEGRQATFDVTARGTSPFTYRWETSDDDGGSWDPVEGATGATLTFRPTLEQDGDLVRVVVDNPVSDPTASKAAHLTVRAQDSDSVSVSDASFLWGLNPIYQGGNPAGNGCNNFSAGTQLEFAGSQGDVRIVHETADGLIAVSDGTKCTDQSTTGMQQRVLLTHGEGSANLETGVASIQWHGAFLANAYGGLVPWWLADLRLTVERDGTGTLTATAGGYGSDMDNPDVMHPIDPRPVTVATFQDVTVTADGITARPDFQGVEITVPDGVSAEAQDRSHDGWGGWPQSFVDFQFETGLSSYWYSSGLSADPDKPAYPFSVAFERALPVREVPAITASPRLVGGPTLVNGRTATVSATVANADSVVWERSTSANGPWTAVEGATSSSFTFTATTDWNNKLVRVVATNADGTVTSGTVQIKTQSFAAPSFTVQPSAITAFDGHRATVTAQATGFPAVLADSYRVQTSLDDGSTWQDVPDAFKTNLSNTFAIPSVSVAQDGALVRVTASTGEGEQAGSPGSTVVSSAVRLTVLPSAGGPQLALVSTTPVDPSQRTTLSVVGAGFSLPVRPSTNESYSLDLALFEADAWHPGTGGLTRVPGTTSSPNTWIGGGAVYDGYLQDRDGTLSVTVTVPAGTLDPAKVYGVGAYSRLTDSSTWADSWADRTNDAWTPVLVAGQSAAQITTQPQGAELPEAGGTARFEVGVSGYPEPSVTWQRRDAGQSGWTALDDASGTVLEVPVTAADDGSAFRALVTNRLGPTQTSSAATVTVASPEPDPVLTTTVPAVAGTVVVGQVLTAEVAGWSDGVAFSYQWLRDGTPIGGATGSTYTLTAADAGATISVAVTGSLAGYPSASETSVPTVAVAKAVLKTATPAVSGTPKVGRTLTVRAAGWTPGTSFSYRWLRGGTPIGGATGSTYTLVAADAGKTLVVEVSGELAGYTTVTKASAAVTVEGVLTAKKPTVVGSVRVGSRIAAKPGSWTTGTSFSYQWLRGGKAIRGATKARYTVVKADVGKKISVRVVGAARGYAAVATTSAAKVARKGRLTVRSRSLAGTGKAGATLRAKVRGWRPGSVRVTYRWYRDGKVIRAATKARYRLVEADAGTRITVKVTASKAGYATVTKVVGRKKISR